MQEIIVKLVVSVFRKAALILGNNNSSPHVDEDVIVVLTTTKRGWRLRELTGCQGILATQGQLLRWRTWSGCSSEDLRHQWWNWGLIISLNACRLLPTSALIHIHQPPPMEFTDDRSIRLGHPLIHTAQQDALNLSYQMYRRNPKQKALATCSSTWKHWCLGFKRFTNRMFESIFRFPILIDLIFFKKDLIPNVADMPPIRAGVGVLKNIINVWYFSPHIILSQKYTLFRWTHGLTTNTGYFGVY